MDVRSAFQANPHAETLLTYVPPPQCSLFRQPVFADEAFQALVTKFKPAPASALAPTPASAPPAESPKIKRDWYQVGAQPLRV